MSDATKLDHRIASAQGGYQAERRRREIAENAAVLALERAVLAEARLSAARKWAFATLSPASRAELLACLHMAAPK